MRIRKRLLRIAAVLAAAGFLFALGLVLYSVRQNQTIAVSEYTVTHKQIPTAFDGMRIVQLTDLHNKDFGDELIQQVRALLPDIIVITGDWIGSGDRDITAAKTQAAALPDIAPTYFVAGNHEEGSFLRDDLFAYLESIGITVLRNTDILLERGNDAIQLVGVFDPEFGARLEKDFAPLVNENVYTILLYHHPEYFEEAVGFGADLMLSGHTHGGQIRLPLIGAVYAPHQKWFPQYDVGRFDSGDSTMIIGQGLGESVYMRILTPPRNRGHRFEK